MDVREVGVVGLGTMGAGIAEVFARAGLRVTAVEADPEALSRGMAILDGSLRKAVSRGRLTEDEYAEIAGRVSPAPAVASLGAADLVIEVVPEQLAIKRQVIAELDQALAPSAIIATNTSSLSVTTIAAGSARPGRVVGMHFFNPAPMMRLVEVVTTVLTDPPVAAAVTALAARLGKTPVQVTDRAGFVANALLLPYLNHAARLFETRYATRDDIDLAMTAGIGLPMGPLALLDLIGLDTSLAVLEVLEREFGGSRYTPAPVLRRMTDAGRTGRKSGAGFYDYTGQRATGPGLSPADDEPDLSPLPGTVTLIDPVATAGSADGGPDAAGTAAGPHSDRAADLASLIAAAGISVTRNPAHASDLAIVAIGPEGGVLGPASAAGRAADAVGLHLPVAPGGPAGAAWRCRAGRELAHLGPLARRGQGRDRQARPARGPLGRPSWPARRRAAVRAPARRGDDGGRRLRDASRRRHGDDARLRVPARSHPAAGRRRSCRGGAGTRRDARRLRRPGLRAAAAVARVRDRRPGTDRKRGEMSPRNRR